MKFLVAMCLLAAGVSAQYGESGIVYPDGTLVQLTREEADNIAAIGESGVVMKDGTHVQFDREMAAHHTNAPPAPMPVPMMLEQQGPLGQSGIVMPEGNNVQFTPEQADNIVLIGPSGVIKANGQHVQLDEHGLPSRPKREVLLEGPSGVLFTDGQKRLLPRGVKIVLLTESGAVLSNGKNVQFRKKRSLPTIEPIIAPSGFITPTSQLFHLPPGVTVAILGDTGALLSDGTAIQFYE